MHKTLLWCAFSGNFYRPVIIVMVFNIKKRISQKIRFFKSDRRDSNPRSRPWQGRALPTTPINILQEKLYFVNIEFQKFQIFFCGFFTDMQPMHGKRFPKTENENIGRIRSQFMDGRLLFPGGNNHRLITVIL